MDKIDMSQFDVSNFDPNAILRGAQLTLVGGKLSPSWYREQQPHPDTRLQSIELSRTRVSSLRTTIDRLLLL
jgi:hypothetical protein